jgi:hypothetical protein
MQEKFGKSLVVFCTIVLTIGGQARLSVLLSLCKFVPERPAIGYGKVFQNI